MMKIFALTVDQELKAKLDGVAEEINYAIDWVKNENKLMGKLRSEEKSIVLLYAPVASDDIYERCRNISQRFPLTSVLLVFETDETLDLKKAIRSGAGDVLFLSDPIEKTRDELLYAVNNYRGKLFQVDQSKHKKDADVITVASTKGGAGKTTVAVNLAAAYGKKVPKIAIIDLDLQFGDVALFFDVRPRRTIYDWVKEDPHGTQIEGFLTPVRNGISILAAPQRPEFAEVITGEAIHRAIQALKKQFDVVIIDVASHMNENVIVALEHSNDILVMTYLDLPTLKNSKLFIDTLISLQLGDRARVVLNRNRNVKGITIDTVEAILEREVFSVIPAMEKAMVTSVNEGKPICFSKPRSKVGRQISRMADQLLQPEQKPKNKQSGQIVHAGGQA